jgi:dTDP-4-amino-4,6-dideoxygalactose transaminase
MSGAATGASLSLERIPLVDLKAQYRAIRPDIERAIAATIESQYFILGPQVESFERDFASYIGVRHAVAVNSGTTALWLALWARGIGPGDEVVTTPSTFFATAEAVLLRGAKPVFADVDPATLLLDAEKAEAAITPKTKALLPVHLYGQAADMDAFRTIARRRGLFLIEDAAQAAGTLYKGKKAGSLGDAAAFSFYPGKNLGAYGDAGAVLTDDDALAEKLRRLRNHGSEKKNHHEFLGTNARIEAFQGGILSAKLRRLDDWNAARRRHAETYRRALAGIQGLSFVEEKTEGRSNGHLFVLRHPRRDALLAHLRGQGIEADIHYPVPCHLQPACGIARRPAGSFPVAEKAASEILSIPLFPELSQAQIERVASAVRSFQG